MDRKAILSAIWIFSPWIILQAMSTLKQKRIQRRTELEQKAGFLRLICQSLTRKMQAETAYHDLLKYLCKENEMRGLQQAAFHLNCSSRHLQRLMNQYEKEGIVIKIGKGAYKLVTETAPDSLIQI